MGQIILTDKIRADLSVAIKAKDAAKSLTLRSLLSDINYLSIEKRGVITDEDILSVIQKSAKKHRESIDMFKKGNRPDLVDKETVELNILTSYLPAQMSEAEIAKIVDNVIANLKPTGPQDFGKVMGAVVSQTKGKADGKIVAEIVKTKLS